MSAALRDVTDSDLPVFFEFLLLMHPLGDPHRAQSVAKALADQDRILEVVDALRQDAREGDQLLRVIESLAIKRSRMATVRAAREALEARMRTPDACEDAIRRLRESLKE